MDWIPRLGARLDSATAVSARLLAGALWAVLATAGMPAGAQLLDSTLDGVLDEQIEQQIEDAAEQQVRQQIEQQVESGVEATIEQQMESGVTETIEQQVESGVTDAIERQLETTIDHTLEEGISAVTERAEDLENAGGAAGADEVLDEVRGAAGGQGGDTPEAGAATPAERFVAAVDEGDRVIERDVWVILVPAEHADQIEGWGFNIRERQDLGAMQRVLLRVDAPEAGDIAQAALDLALDAPGTRVDFNHVYRGTNGEPSGAPDAAVGYVEDGSLGPSPARPTLAVGIIDSAVAADHEALSAADIVQRDFVPFAGDRPIGHGTAVASILIGESFSVRGHLAGGRLYAASVFFVDDEGRPAATTASLVEALEWLTAEGLPVVNMSLSGPPNRVLEAAVDTVAESGVIVVAAVGNNGPAGEPLYPAAYRTVVGVTAVDSANRIYHYANRGRQVTFSAPGVRIDVARGGGGYGRETGTSMAAPYAAAMIVRSVAALAGESTASVLAALKAAAIDLGERDFDDVFGYGLIAALD